MSITIQPEDVWEFFQPRKKELKTKMLRIADNIDYGVKVFLTESAGHPKIVVEMDDEEVYSETCIGKEDTRETTNRVYNKYLTSQVINEVFGEQEDDAADDADMPPDEEDYDEIELDRMEMEEEIDEREMELDEAIYNFVETVLDAPLDDFITNADEVYDDLKEHFLEYMARKWGLMIRRPMFLEDEAGEEFFEEFPYDCIEFEDEDNPIYK